MAKKKRRSQPVYEFNPEMLREDPSFNARQVTKDAVKRINDLSIQHNKLNHDLRKTDERLHNFRFKVIKEREKLIESHNKELRKTEKGRLDSIRQVDQTNATNTAVSLAASLKTFGDTASTNAENLRNQLNSTATNMQKTTADLAVTLATQQALRDENNNKRFTALEQSAYVTVGKEKVSDPIMSGYMSDIKDLLGKKSEGIGAKNLWGLIVGGIILLIAIIKFLTTGTI